jgi:hypothetical protein
LLLVFWVLALNFFIIRFFPIVLTVLPTLVADTPYDHIFSYIHGRSSTAAQEHEKADQTKRFGKLEKEWMELGSPMPTYGMETGRTHMSLRVEIGISRESRIYFYIISFYSESIA